MLLTGIDIIEIHRIKDVCQKYPNRFMKKIFTDQEIDYCRGRFPQIAARFASKEAVMKALGTGVRGVGKTTTARIIAKSLNCLNIKEYSM